MISPRRGEIWWVNLDPTVGDEIKKTRPAVVLSTDALGSLRLKLAAPITSRAESGKPWLVPVRANGLNGLKQDGCIDVLQVRGLSLDRFSKRIGMLNADDIDEVVAALALVVDL
ncbi:MAG: type II toxin-antitoxin system PemK/MazF family toxin [Coriobacteriia bacterium]